MLNNDQSLRNKQLQLQVGQWQNVTIDKTCESEVQEKMLSWGFGLKIQIYLNSLYLIIMAYRQFIVLKTQVFRSFSKKKKYDICITFYT